MDTTNTSRRRVLECMAWAGAGVLWRVHGGVPRSALIGSAEAAETGSFSFVQISDSHIGFRNPPNPDTPGTLRDAVQRVRAVKGHAAMMIHAGDVSHLSSDSQFNGEELHMLAALLRAG